jgi:hypothetical protein
MNQHSTILHPLSELFDYISGRKTPSEQYLLERQMQHDAFLEDAMEGLLQTEEDKAVKEVANINTMIHRRSRFTLRKKFYAGVAASLILLIIATMVIFVLKWNPQSQKPTGTIAENTSSQINQNKTDAFRMPPRLIGYKSPATPASTIDDTFIPATPLGGLEAFNDYIVRNAILSDNAPVNHLTVKIRFEIDPAGRPVKFVKIQSPGEGYYESAKKVIAEGPKWIPATSNNMYINTPVEISITFYKTQ